MNTILVHWRIYRNAGIFPAVMRVLFASTSSQDGTKDVLIATDIAAKGLDFPDIQHVINYDMPNEIENYVHRIGRTGRCGKTGVATTFINKVSETGCFVVTYG